MQYFYSRKKVGETTHKTIVFFTEYIFSRGQNLAIGKVNKNLEATILKTFDFPTLSQFFTNFSEKIWQKFNQNLTETICNTLCTNLNK